MTNERPERAHGGHHAPTSGQPVLDLSTCVDAFGLFAPLQQALTYVNESQSYATYPDPTALQARQSIADVCHVEPAEVDVGPGAAEIIWTIVRTYVRANERVLIWEPCFSEFAHAAHAVSGSLITHRGPNDDLAVEARIQAFGEATRVHAPKVAYLCAPTSPRGEWLPAALLLTLVNQHPSTLFVIDQSYLSMSQHVEDLDLRFPSNAVLLRSVTKELGVPGIRAGYAVMAANLRTAVQGQRPYWSLGAHAQAVLNSYAACQPFLRERRQLMLQQAQVLSQELTQLGWRPELFDTPYFTARAPKNSHQTARDVATHLLQSHAIAVRDCTSFGLPDHVRMVAHPHQARLVCALSPA